jgi:hypothetical protein
VALAWLTGVGLGYASGCTSLEGLAGAPDASIADAPEAAAEASPGDASPASCSCAAPAPVGWTGPLALYDGNPANAPSCASGTHGVLSAFADLDAGPAACPGCTCSAATVQCATGNTTDVDIFDASACTGRCSSFGGATNDYCISLAFPSIDGGSVPPTCNGAMTPTRGASACVVTDGGAPTLPQFVWGRAGVGCAGDPQEPNPCDGGALCLTANGPPFGSHLCVLQQGDVACPGAPYSSKELFYHGVDDTRGCGACSCATTCVTSVSSYADTKCANLVAGPTPFAMCASLGNDPQSVMFHATPGCVSDGGAPTGAVTPSGPVTVCCSP